MWNHYNSRVNKDLWYYKRYNTYLDLSWFILVYLWFIMIWDNLSYPYDTLMIRV